MGAGTEITRLDLIDKAKLDELLSSDLLPKVTAEDNGLALLVVNGKWAKATILTLPSVTTEDNGKGLVVSSGLWVTKLLSELPDPSQATDGATLQVSNGKWVIVEPQAE